MSGGSTDDPLESGALRTSLYEGQPRVVLDRLALGHRAAHLDQRLFLELAHSLAREAVLVADLFQRALAVVHQTKPLAQDVGLDRLEPSERLEHLALRLGRRHLVGYRRPLVGVDENVD